MTTAEDFVVVDDGSVCANGDATEHLRALVEEFTKALNTVNQTNRLLKDELQCALSVTLEHVCPDRTTLIEDLAKLLDTSFASPEDVRKDYLKRIYSRLVAVNEEKMALFAENTSLREAIKSKEKDFEKQVMDASLRTRNIEQVLAQLECSEISSPNLSESISMNDLCTCLNGIYERLSRLNVKSLTTPQVEANAASMMAEERLEKASFEMVSVGVSACDELLPPPVSASCVAVQANLPTIVPVPVEGPNFQNIVDDLPLPPIYAGSTGSEPTERQDPQISHGMQASDFSAFGLEGFQGRGSESTGGPTPLLMHMEPEGARRGTPQPSFSANQEEPFCPCCNQRFASRDELEDHLLSCLS